MSAFGSTGVNAGASENALAITSSDNNAVAKDNGIALGANASLNAGVQLGNTQGNVTIGETGLGAKLVDALREVTERNGEFIATAASSLPSPRSDLTSSPTVTDQVVTIPGALRDYWWIGAALVALVLAGLFLRGKR